MMYIYHHAMLPIALQDVYIKQYRLPLLGPGNIIYCMFLYSRVLAQPSDSNTTCDEDSNTTCDED